MRTIVQKNKEIIISLFSVVVAVLLNIGLFTYFHQSLKIHELVANLIAWIITVLAVFILERITGSMEQIERIREYIDAFLVFAGERVLTLAVEEMLLYIMITRIEIAGVPVKIITQGIVIVFNYIIVKCYLFEDYSGKG